MFFRKKLLLLKIESTYGTDAAPVAATDAVQGSNFRIEPLRGGRAARNLERTTLGNQARFLINKNVAVTFEVEIAGGGAAGTVPAYGPALRACAMAETNTPAVDTQYDPISDRSTMESVTIHFNLDGTLHALLGARGSVSMSLAPEDGDGAVPKFAFSMVGLFVAPSAVALGTPTLTAWKDPIPVSNTNTPTFALHGFSGIMERFGIDLANQVAPRLLVGQEEIIIGDRAPAGSVSIQAPALATKDFFAIASADPPTLGALQIVHGTVAGNIVQIDAPKVELANPTYTDSQGDAMLDMDLTLLPDAGDDEVKITVK